MQTFAKDITLKRLSEPEDVAPDGDMIPNIVHGSDSEESAAREIKIWFGE